MEPDQNISEVWLWAGNLVTYLSCGVNPSSTNQTQYQLFFKKYNFKFNLIFVSHTSNKKKQFHWNSSSLNMILSFQHKFTLREKYERFLHAYFAVCSAWHVFCVKTFCFFFFILSSFCSTVYVVFNTIIILLHCSQYFQALYTCTWYMEDYIDFFYISAVTDLNWP